MSWTGYIPGDLLNEVVKKMPPLVQLSDNELFDYHWDRLRSEYTDIEARADLLWYAIDLDGTLAEGIWTPDNPTHKIGYPIWENVHKAREVEAAGYKIIIHTSRAWTDYENIEGWLNHYNVPYRRIVCGKLLAVRYVDDRAIHADDESWLPRED